MYTYNIQYGAHDTSDCSHLQHNKKFSREEMREMFKEALISILKEKKKKNYTSFDFEYIATYENCHLDLLDYFCEHFGFQKMKFDMKVDLYGAGRLLKQDWESYGEDDDILYPIVPEIAKELIGKNQLSKLENVLMRKGNVLTRIGLYRSIAINNYTLSKKRFHLLVKKNYMIEELDDNFLKEIDKIWDDSITMFKKWGVLISGTSDNIEIKDPMYGFFDEDERMGESKY